MAPSLIALAKQSKAAPSSAEAAEASADGPILSSNTAASGSTDVKPSLGARPRANPTSGTVSSRSTPALSEGSRASVTPGPGPGIGGAPVVPAPRLKFRPNRPAGPPRRETSDIKPDATALAAASARGTPPARDVPSSQGGPSSRGNPSTRGAPSVRGTGQRGRGRGGQAGGARGPKAPTETVGVGIFGQARHLQAQGSSRRQVAVGPRMDMMPDYEEEYSDNEDDASRRDIIDIDKVYASGGTAPTSAYRDRRTKEEKAKAKAERADVKRQVKSVRRAARAARATQDVDMAVKDEPISPEKRAAPLPDATGDVVMGDDSDGARLRSFARTGGVEVEPEEEEEAGVNKAQAVDLSESESEEEEEGMEGDFVQIEGGDAPDSKLFMFQFPHLFPHYIPRPIDATTVDGAADAKPDVKPDVKPNVDVKPDIRAHAPRPTGRKAKAPPEGRIGTMVVMKSGKVKMVMGDEIVMNVTPGVPTSFIQQIVHLDQHKKHTNVLGEVHRSYVVTPDIDRLLSQLYVEGGLTPGDKIRIKEEQRRQELMEMRMVKVEDD